MQVEEEGQGVLERTVLAYIERVFARHECEGAAACLLGVDIQRFADNQHKCRIEVQLRGDLVSHIAREYFQQAPTPGSQPAAHIGRLKRQQRLQKLIITALAAMQATFYEVVITKEEGESAWDAPAVVSTPPKEVLLERVLKGEERVLAEAVVLSVNHAVIEVVRAIEHELGTLWGKAQGSLPVKSVAPPAG